MIRNLSYLFAISWSEVGSLMECGMIRAKPIQPVSANDHVRDHPRIGEPVARIIVIWRRSHFTEILEPTNVC